MKIKEKSGCLFTKNLSVAISNDALQIKGSTRYDLIFSDGETIPCDAVAFVNSLLTEPLPGVGGVQCEPL